MIPGNAFLQAWREKIALKITDLPSKPNWGYLGNSIFKELYQDPEIAAFVHIKDKEPPERLVERAVFGAIMLHHYWTSMMYKNATIVDILEHPCTLSGFYLSLSEKELEHLNSIEDLKERKL